MSQCAPPKTLWVGLGCRSGTLQADLAAAIRQVCLHHALAEAAIVGIATLDIKLQEIGLVNLCASRDWPLYGFSAEQLGRVSVPQPTQQIAAKVGTASVAEAAALLAAGGHLLVPKQIIRGEGASGGTVTIAVACTTGHQMVVQ